MKDLDKFPILKKTYGFVYANGKHSTKNDNNHSNLRIPTMGIRENHNPLGSSKKLLQTIDHLNKKGNSHDIIIKSIYQ